MGDSSSDFRPLLPGAILALLAILFGFGLGGAFGAAEDSIKGSLRSSADAVFDTVYQGDAGKRDAVLSKSWAYMKRAHMHGAAIGTAALSAILLLALLGNAGLFERILSLSLGAGALLYGIFWMLAAFTAPSLGSTSAAKESLGFLAVPGAGLSLLGVCGTLFVAVRELFAPSRPGS